MVESELFIKFEKLSTNDKRNAFNEEMIKIFGLLTAITKIKETETENLNISNYNSNTEKSISEDEYLVKAYKDLINIRKVLINYISTIESKK